MLELNGMRLSDFKTHAEALKTADQIVAQSKKDLGHNQPDIPHENPLLVKVFYVHGQGKKRSWSQNEKKEFVGESDVKSQKQLGDAAIFIEGLGVGSSSSGEAGVKIENTKFVKMNQGKDSLRSVVLTTSNHNDLLQRRIMQCIM